MIRVPPDEHMTMLRQAPAALLSPEDDIEVVRPSGRPRCRG
ncbi:hypothetical protein ACSDR0_41165 [Streptosporangium sp. G11]